MPAVTSVIGEVGTEFSGLGMMGLAAGPVRVPSGATVPLPPSMPSSALPLIAHVYDYKWVFQYSLTVLNRPKLKQAVNAGYEKITLEVDTGSLLSSFLAPGNVVTLTEQGGDGSVIYGGMIEQTVDRIEGGQTVHQVTLTPFVAEVADGSFDAAYTSPTDVAQIVRDACAGLHHVWYTWLSVPLTGVLVTATFNATTPHDALDQVLKMAGSNYSWHVDAIGCLWFQPSGSVPMTATTAQMRSREISQDAADLKNQIQVFGGVQTDVPSPGSGSQPVQGLYNGSSQTQYGVRRWDPPPVYPGITDPVVVQKIADTLGSLFDRVKNVVTLVLPNYPQRILIGQLGSSLMRYLEPVVYPQAESESGSGVFSPSYVVLDVETEGILQVVTLGDLAYNTQQDFQWEVVRTLQRTSINSKIYTPDSLNTLTVVAPTGTTVVQDNSGVQRLQWGNLAAYTDSSGHVSPAQIGLRILDANGSLVMDAFGFFGSAVSAFAPAGPINLSVSVVASPSYSTINSTTFTLSRPTTILSWAVVTVQRTDVAAGSVGANVGLQLDGNFNGGSPFGDLSGDLLPFLIPAALNGNASTVLCGAQVVIWREVAAGQHTLALVGQKTAGTVSVGGSPEFSTLGGAIGG